MYPLINTMKTSFFLASAALLGFSVQAQTLQDATTKTTNERFDAAAADLRSLISKDPAKGENYFYLGENYYAIGMLEQENATTPQDKKAALAPYLDSARMTYQKGVDMNATNPLNYVGLGKVAWFNGKTDDAKAQFYKAATLSQNKSAEVMRRTAEAYIDGPSKNADEAINLLNNAMKLEPKNAENHILMGDALLEKNPVDGGPAIKEYNKANELNPKSPVGILRSGRLYARGRNFKLADDYYKQAQALDPNFAPAYRVEAELYFSFQQPAKAVELWKKYLQLNNSNYFHYRFATSLYSSKQYCDAIPELEYLKKNSFNSYYVPRIMAYSYYECGDKTDKDAYVKGLAASDEFFSKAPKDQVISQDYKYRGALLSKLGKDSLAVIELEKASSDTSKAREMAGDLAKTYYKLKKYDKAIESYKRKSGGNDYDNLGANELLELGRAYYFGPKDYVLADTAFSMVIRKSVTTPIGYSWRARARYTQDMKIEAETKSKEKRWSSKDDYEKFIELVKPEERSTNSYKPLVIEAAKYLGDYYINSKEKNLEKAKQNWQLVLDLDPNDKQAKAFFNPPKQAPKK